LIKVFGSARIKHERDGSEFIDVWRNWGEKTIDLRAEGKVKPCDDRSTRSSRDEDEDENEDEDPGLIICDCEEGVGFCSCVASPCLFDALFDGAFVKNERREGPFGPVLSFFGSGCPSGGVTAGRF